MILVGNLANEEWHLVFARNQPLQAFGIQPHTSPTYYRQTQY